MPKILAQTPSGQKIIKDSFFANFAVDTPLGERYEPVSAKSSDKKLVYGGHRKLTLEPVTIQHLLKVATDIPSPVLSNNALTITVASPLIVDGVVVDAGEEIIMSREISTALGTSPGLWRADSQTQITLINPPTYTMNDVWAAIGAPWRYRMDGADIIGVIPITPAAQVRTNLVGSTLGMARLLDGNIWSYADASSASTLSFRVSFTAVNNVRRIAVTATSARERTDTSMPSAKMGLQDQSGGGIGNLFYNLDTGAQQSTGQVTWATGQTTIYSTQEIDRTVSAFTINKPTGARTYVSIELCVDGNSQIRIGGEIPTNGSLVTIPEWVADNFYPAIAPGTWQIVTNDNTGPWRLRKI